MRRPLAALALLALAAPLAAKQAAPSPAITAAVAAPDRPATQTALDEGRKPAQVLAFLGLKPGMTAADIMAGAGYYSEIMASVVGPKGMVSAFEPEQFMNDPRAQKPWAELKARRANVALIPYPFDKFSAAPASLDFTLLHLTYHDLYWESAQYKVPRTDPAAFLAALYKAMKPGGIVGVVDHVAAPGDTRATVDKLHRIDPEVVKADFKAAGFVLEGESDLLRVPGDDHSKLVFDPSVRGKTDRFVFRFRKPKK
ncbi:MAG: methyltransferase [Sphingomonas sp.]|uniref:class I SAM-dependent methyltransferase n=1 Tax=Sphingomonas sp. TaxID=28214 RepID=UPI0025E62DE2|nr:methyltransferase [Sphingomonas sp.]MBX9883226.1 methyltransferase [Sphingomonas sp.]